MTQSQTRTKGFETIAGLITRVKEGEDSTEFFKNYWPNAAGLNKEEREWIVETVKSLPFQSLLSQSRAFLLEGMYRVFIADFYSALECLHESEKLFTELTDNGGVLASKTLLSICHRSIGQLDKAQDKLRTAVQLAPTVSDDDCCAYFKTIAYYQSAELSVQLKNYQRAIEYFTQGMEYKNGGPDLEGRLLTGLGNVWLQLKEYDKSIDAYLRALLSIKDVNNPLLESKIYSDIGNYYFVRKNFQAALENNEKSLQIRLKYNYLNPAITNYIQLAELYFEMGNIEKAIEHGEKAVEESRKFKVLIKEYEAHEILSRLYEQVNNSMKALEHFKEFHKQKEEVHNQETMRRVEQINSRHKVEMMEQEKEIFRLKNVELKALLDEIQESIRYAKRIQTAILPSEKMISSWLPQSFVLYHPRDIVAGDFYWMAAHDETVLIAACDCTGHGVPGAMVSVVCNNALNRVVNEFGKTIPGEILDKTCDLVIETFTSFNEFEQDSDSVKDGMDISLCAITKNKLQFAGANNGIWIIRDKNLIEIKATKQPVGKHINRQKFVTHEFELQKGDTLYLFSDGFADQFGGEKGKKFSSKRLKELLVEHSRFPAEIQKENISSVFHQWKGKLEQVDDVLVIGVMF